MNGSQVIGPRGIGHSGNVGSRLKECVRRDESEPQREKKTGPQPAGTHSPLQLHLDPSPYKDIAPASRVQPPQGLRVTVAYRQVGRGVPGLKSPGTDGTPVFGESD